VKFKMAEKSLFAILLRSSWWMSFAAAGAVLLVARLVLPEQYVIGGAMAALPFIGIGCVTAWRQLRAPSAARVAATLKIVEAMSWREFSAAIEDAFVRDGYAVKRPGGAAADFELTRAGRLSLVCCKRWKAASAGIEALRELQAAREAREAQEAIYVAIGGVTGQARQYATKNQLRLIEGVELAQLLRAVRRAK
jgi:restriction system protein